MTESSSQWSPAHRPICPSSPWRTRRHHGALTQRWWVLCCRHWRPDRRPTDNAPAPARAPDTPTPTPDRRPVQPLPRSEPARVQSRSLTWTPSTRGRRVRQQLPHPSPPPCPHRSRRRRHRHGSPAASNRIRTERRREETCSRCSHSHSHSRSRTRTCPVTSPPCRVANLRNTESERRTQGHRSTMRTRPANSGVSPPSTCPMASIWRRRARSCTRWIRVAPCASRRKESPSSTVRTRQAPSK